MARFRDLRADEIEVRVAETRQNGLTLLLYKDARCDMSILDEEVGAENWQREHYECKGNLFCRVGIRSADGGWVWKSDAGAPSNFESEKGEASDSFKRACTNWGIGRELYTAPRIFIGAAAANIKQGRNGKFACYDKFEVAKIATKDHVIKAIAIANATRRKVVFTYVADDYGETREVYE